VVDIDGRLDEKSWKRRIDVLFCGVIAVVFQFFDAVWVTEGRSSCESLSSLQGAFWLDKA